MWPPLANEALAKQNKTRPGGKSSGRAHTSPAF
jgi:hypothetical protein